MTNPFAYVPFAVAAHGGSVDGIPAAQLAMAGITLLRSSAPLVRALSGRPSAILMRPGAAFLTALSASDGRAALLLDPAGTADDFSRALRDAQIGAVFTVRGLAALLPSGMTHVLLDEVPRRATIVTGDSTRVVALTGQHALRLDGEADEAGADEPCIVIAADRVSPSSREVTMTHRALLERARSVVVSRALQATGRVLAPLSFASADGLIDGLIDGLLAPLLAGAAVVTTNDMTDAPMRSEGDL